MGEASHQWTKKRKIASKNAVCEDCGRKWTATLAEVPVTIFISDLDEFYKKLSKNLLEAVEPPMVLCVFRPSDRDIRDSEITLSCVAPRQDTPYRWRICHKHNGPAAASGCQIIPWRDKNLDSKSKDQDIVIVTNTNLVSKSKESPTEQDKVDATYKNLEIKSEDSSTEEDIVTFKDEDYDEGDEEIIEEKGFDPLADDKNSPWSPTVRRRPETSPAPHGLLRLTPPVTQAGPQATDQVASDPDEPVPANSPPAPANSPPAPANSPPAPASSTRAPPPALRWHQRSKKPSTAKKARPTVRCIQCYFESGGRVRKETTYICALCPTTPGLCTADCFEKYHNRIWEAPVPQAQPRSGFTLVTGRTRAAKRRRTSARGTRVAPQPRRLPVVPTSPDHQTPDPD